MYESPIEVILGQMRVEYENDIVKAVQEKGIFVDKDEIIKALRYDRQQYAKGFEDGKRAALEEFMESRCRCRYQQSLDWSK